MSDPRLRRYVSRLQLAKIAAREPGSEDPSREEARAAALWVDVSGFTSLTKELAEKGPAGVEEVSQVMSGYFGRITDIATGTGGDVVSYAGDGALILWSEHSSGGLATATALAAQAGSVVQREFREFALVPGVSLGLRVAIGAGAVVISEVGGVDGVWQFLVSGDAVEQAVRADRHSAIGDVLLSPEAWEQISEWAAGTPVETGEVRLDALSRPFSPHGERADPLLASDDDLTPYVPQIALDRLAAEQERWLGEFRGVSVMFVDLRGLGVTNRDTLLALHEVVRSIQTEVVRQEGQVYQFLTDDKGTTLIAAFGLPLNAHVDDAARCVETALAIEGRVSREAGVGVGIATGQAYCGLYGGWDRRQYAVVGPVMNRASRLAQQAEGILCDESVVRAAESHRTRRFEALDPLRLKGEAGEVAVYEPASELSREARHRTVVGREQEQSVLEDAIDRLRDRRAGGVVIVRGAEGFGKSLLIADFLRRARDAEVACMVGEIDEAQRGTPYSLWRSILSDLLESAGPGDAASEGSGLDSSTLAAHIGRGLPEDESIRELLPLLGDVLPIDLADTSLSSRLQGEVRAENTRRLLLSMFGAAARAGPAAFVLEDAHLGDSASWQLIVEVARQIPELLLVVEMRLVDSPPDGFRALAGMDGTLHLKLGPLSREQVGELLADRLDTPDIPPPVVDLIFEKAAGHPFFSEELGYALRDSGVVGGAEAGAEPPVRTAQDLEERLGSWTPPPTVHGAITKRLDRLGADELLTLRAASAIGQTFTLHLLRDVYPVETERDKVPEHLSELTRLELTRLESDGREPTYGFKHAITRDVAYNSLPFAQRRELHRRIAEWHEAKHGSDVPQLFAPLGHHWMRAGEPEAASAYLGRAGEHALRQYANREAARLLEDALAQGEEGGVPEEQKADWQLQLGRAYVNWSRYEDALPHLQSGITRHGLAAPRHRLAATIHLLGQLSLQALHRLMPDRLVGRRREDGDRLLPLVPAYEGLVESHYLAGSTVPCLHAAVRSLNLAESVGPSVELARGYASFGAIMGFVPLHAVAESYCRRAVETAREVDDPSGSAWVLLATGVYEAGKGAWEEAAAFLGEAARISEELGDRRRWEDCTQHLATISYLTGDFQDALQKTESLFVSALGGSTLGLSKSGASEANVVRQLAALRIKAHCLISTGSFEAAAKCAQGIRELLQGRSTGVLDQGPLVLAALEALISALQSPPDDAKNQAEEAAALLGTAGVSSYEMLLEYSAAAEACLTLSGLNGHQEDAVRSGSRRAVKRLSAHARVFPIARPAANLWRGVLLRQLGKERQAFAALKRSAAAAHHMQMPLFEGLSRLHTGLQLDPSSEERIEELTSAVSILERIGARHHAAQARTALEKR